MFLPLLCANPELVERPETREDAPAKPRAVPPFGGMPGGVDFCSAEMPDEFVMQPLNESSEERAAAVDDDVGEELDSQVGLARHEGRIEQLRQRLREGATGLNCGG